MNKYHEMLETMCRRCVNHEICRGTGCNPKSKLQELIDLYETDPVKSLVRKEIICETCGFSMQYDVNTSIKTGKQIWVCAKCGKRAVIAKKRRINK